MKIFLSNRTERLYDRFQERLYMDSNPLSKRIVIVPSAAMKSWLMLKLAQDSRCGIAAGIEIGFIDPMVHRLHSRLNQESADTNEPSCQDLAFAIEHAIYEKGNNSNGVEGFWKPIADYLGIFSHSRMGLSEKDVRRTIALSQTVATIFLEYGYYGAEMVSRWCDDEPKSWQQALWQQMEEVFARWDYLGRKLDRFQIAEDHIGEDLHIHLFGISYLSPLHHRFFNKLNKAFKLNYYLLSPCQKFWSDIVSHKESVMLEKYWKRRGVAPKQQVALDVFLRDNNPLLANFGRLGREMAAQIDSGSYCTYESYVLPASVLEHSLYKELVSEDIDSEDDKRPLSLLEAVQADITLLRNPEASDRIAFSAYDETIQIHAAPKRLREAQAVYDAILKIIDKHHLDEEPIVPRDVVVMAPNMADYIPHIQSTFETEESRLHVQIMDVMAPIKNPFIKAFLHLLDLSEGRWDVISVMQLFGYPAFQKKHGFTAQDVEKMTLWVKDVGIRWGIDPEHRDEMLRNGHCEKGMAGGEVGTWEGGFNRLLDGLARLNHSSVGQADFQHGELLGVFIQVLRSLYIDLQPFVSGVMLSLCEWATYFRCILEVYFLPSTDEELEGMKVLENQLFGLDNSGKYLPCAQFPFLSVYERLRKSLEKETVSYKESNLSAVRFCSLLPMRAVPSKVIVLMGMDEEAFPRRNEIQSLNMLAEYPGVKDYQPTQVDQDRYLFLETILSARRYLILSYTCQRPGDPQEYAPSLLVKELQTYLDQSYCTPEGIFSKLCLYKHPLLPFHSSYFSPDSKLKSYSHSLFQAALAYYSQDKRPLKSFIDGFSCPAHSVEFAPSVSIDLSELVAFARNPLKKYFNKKLGVYLTSKEDRKINEDEDFLLPHLQKHFLLKESLHHTPLTVLDKAQMHWRLPIGPFKLLETQKLYRDMVFIEKTLHTHSIGKLFSIEFNELHVEAKTSESSWFLPQIEMEVFVKSKVKLSGKIECVSNRGMIILAKDDIKEAFKQWPAILAFQYLLSKYHLPIDPKVIFLHVDAEAVREISVTDPERLLKNYIEYYIQSENTLSPLVPEAIKSFLAQSHDDCRKCFQESSSDFEFAPLYNEYLRWLQESSPSLDVVKHFDAWHTKANLLFSELQGAWGKS